MSSPIVVASVTRCGSTLLQRLLSTHEDLTIWGEHFGLLSHLRAMHDRAARSSEQLERGHLQADALVRGPMTLPDDLSPQVNPFGLEQLEDEIRSMVLRLFRRGLSPRSRWGFKEVHYFEDDLRFLHHLFPSMRLIVLVRRPETQISSYVRAPWREIPKGSDARQDVVTDLVTTAAHTWTSKYLQLMKVVQERASQSLVVRYEDLVGDQLDFDELFGFCGLDTPDAAALRSVLERRELSSSGTSAWDRSTTAALEEQISKVTFPEAHPEVLRFFYPS
ncbi:MAG: sulfotransferase family protein [Acidimicrobiales bacterium]